jgi:mannitol/fructose-specific phosphotransferase system IIA component (Ntr-type)
LPDEPLGMLLSLLVVMTCYTLMVTVTTGVLPGDALNNSLTPISDGAAAIVGHWGARLMAVAAATAFITTATAGILAASRYLLAPGPQAYATGFVLVLVGFLTYWFYGRARATHDYALLHLLQRMTARQLVTGGLESELREIIRERDTIVLDDFDRLVEAASVLDLSETLERDVFFRRAAEVMSSRVGIPAAEFYRLLVARESDSSTVLAPGLAIPHIVVEQDMPMAILIARCLPGIRFSETDRDVRAVLVLAGSHRDRNLHLRCLAAIAQIVRSPDFSTRWARAQGEQALRDIFLLGERLRERV